VADLKAYILCRFAENSGIYNSWLKDVSAPTVVVDEFLPDWHLPADAGILITHMHYRWEELATLRKIHAENQVPILILSDGILEYRNTWEHPGLADGSIFQPVCGHKLACLGRGQARVIESWGNVGKCEVVGLPRLDAAIESEPPPTQTSGPFRLLIATANSPAFNDQQRQTVVRSLQMMKHKLSETPSVNGRPIEVNWRLSDDLETELGIDVDSSHELPPLREVIDHVDAVITTPSTMYLESIQRKRPAAMLDFHNSPQYVPSAWVISADVHFDGVLAELADPPAHKMLFQASVLHDQLECRTPALPRMLRLIQTMLESKRHAQETLEPLDLPNRILPDEQLGFATVPANFDLATLYPNNPVFQQQDLQRLQVELSAAIKRLDQLPLELAEKNTHITQLTAALDQARFRVEEMHNRIIEIRKRFGIEPADSSIAGQDLSDE
jgi:hypothetical protein